MTLLGIILGCVDVLIISSYKDYNVPLSSRKKYSFWINHGWLKLVSFDSELLN